MKKNHWHRFAERGFLALFGISLLFIASRVNFAEGGEGVAAAAGSSPSKAEAKATGKRHPAADAQERAERQRELHRFQTEKQSEIRKLREEERNRLEELRDEEREKREKIREEADFRRKELKKEMEVRRDRVKDEFKRKIDALKNEIEEKRREMY